MQNRIDELKRWNNSLKLENNHIYAANIKNKNITQKGFGNGNKTN